MLGIFEALHNGLCKMTAYDQVFYPIFGLACAIAFIASFFAARKSGCVVPAALLVVGMVAFWAGLLIGIAKGYRAWQSIPKPPDEAFYDGEKVWALFFGWLPGAVFCGSVFGFIRLVGYLLSRGTSNSHPTEPVSKPVETNNPYQSPPS